MLGYDRAENQQGVGVALRLASETLALLCQTRPMYALVRLGIETLRPLSLKGPRFVCHR